jgi:hypothetical protein
VNDSVSAGDEIPPGHSVIEVHVGELEQLFNHIDPSPFHDRDLDRSTEEFIVDWSRDFPGDAPLGLVVHLDRPVELPRQASVLGNAIHQYFAARARTTRRRLRELLRRGRTSLIIGLAFLGAAVGASELIEDWLDPGGVLNVVRESLLIGGWVAMWRPIEVFLYDWWPIRAEARLYDRLAAMLVRIDASGAKRAS